MVEFEKARKSKLPVPTATQKVERVLPSFMIIPVEKMYKPACC